jgi:hypothetical protein
MIGAQRICNNILKETRDQKFALHPHNWGVLLFFPNKRWIFIPLK